MISKSVLDQHGVGESPNLVDILLQTFAPVAVLFLQGTDLAVALEKRDFDRIEHFECGEVHGTFCKQ